MLYLLENISAISPYIAQLLRDVLCFNRSPVSHYTEMGNFGIVVRFLTFEHIVKAGLEIGEEAKVAHHTAPGSTTSEDTIVTGR